MKYALLFLIVSCFANQLQAQEKTSKAFYTEMGGPGVLFSANIDSRFNPKSYLGFGFRAGIGFTIKDDYIDDLGYSKVRSIPTLPLGVNYLLGKNGSPHTFEIGAGTTILFRKTEMLNWFDNDKKGNLIGHVSFMYRRQPIDNGFMWRIGFTPIINTSGDIVPFGAIGIGYAFK